MDVTAEKIIAINALETGDPHGMLNYGNAAFIADEINNEPDVFRKAALALYRINTVHPFIDGNKRCGFILSQMILADAGFELPRNTNENFLYHYIVDVAMDRESVDDIADLFRNCVLDQ